MNIEDKLGEKFSLNDAVGKFAPILEAIAEYAFEQTKGACEGQEGAPPAFLTLYYVAFCLMDSSLATASKSFFYENHELTKEGAGMKMMAITTFMTSGLKALFENVTKDFFKELGIKKTGETNENKEGVH